MEKPELRAADTLPVTWPSCGLFLVGLLCGAVVPALRGTLARPVQAHLAFVWLSDGKARIVESCVSYRALGEQCQQPSKGLTRL